MKMPEKYTIGCHSRQKEQGIGAIPVFAMAYLRGADIMAVRLQKQ